MFSKQKKTPQSTKAKSTTKSKTVSVKSGIKGPPGKKMKTTKSPRSRPAQRVDPGYSLYFSNSEDQVKSAFTEMETCEKILNQLRAKRKVMSEKEKSRGSTVKIGEPDKIFQPGNMDRDIGVTSALQMYENRAHTEGQFLRQFTDIEPSTNIPFNRRLTSSTPDPDRLFFDLDGTASRDPMLQDIPERDVNSAFSRNTINHNPHPNHFGADSVNSIRAAYYSGSQNNHGTENFQSSDKNSEHQAMTGSLGFYPNLDGFPSQVGELVQTGSQNQQTGSLPQFIIDGSFYDRRESDIGAFQPYLNRESFGFVPLPFMFRDAATSPVNTLSRFNQTPSTSLEERETVELVSGRSGNSGSSDKPVSVGNTTNTSGTDYAPLPRPAVPEKGQVDKVAIPGPYGATLYRLDGGLYELHSVTETNKTSSQGSASSTLSTPVRKISPSRSPKPSPKEQRSSQQQHQVWEAPERDSSVTSSKQKSASSTPDKNSKGTSDTFTVDSKNMSVNSAVTNTSTLTTTSTIQSGQAQDGVNIPTILMGGTNFSAQNIPQNVIGYIPALNQSQLSGTDQSSTHFIYLPNYGLVKMPNQGLPSGVQGQTPLVSEMMQAANQREINSAYLGTQYPSSSREDMSVKRFRHLLKELKECNKVTKDAEINRLVTELEQTVNSIPQLGLAFNLQTEIDLALQPLRSENCQLRRRLRLVNQQLKEKEIQEGKKNEPRDINFEILHLQASNDTMKRLLQEEKEAKAKVVDDIRNLKIEVNKMKLEKNRIIAEVSERNTGQIRLRQETVEENRKLKQELDKIKKEKEALSLKLDSSDQENHILQLSLQQRDVETTRLQKMVQTMKKEISELLLELDQSRHGDKSWISNNSFHLQKLLHIIEEDNTVSMWSDPGQHVTLLKRTTASPDKKRIRFQKSEKMDTVSPRLTRQALAVHNKQNPRSKSQEAQNRANGDKADDHLLDVSGNIRIKPQESKENNSKNVVVKHLRTSSSSPVHFRVVDDSMQKHKRTFTSPVYERGRAPLREFEDSYDISRSEKLQEDGTGHGSGLTVSSTPNKFGTRRAFDEVNSDAPKLGMNQSRYSVTDYFQKYPRAVATGLKVPPDLQQKSEFISRSPQKVTSALVQERGRPFDVSISAIDDDNVSSVSAQTTSTVTTVDEGAFKTGLATLDANIAKLQMALKRTKEMLS
ncbi:hypothetical protein CHS0354_037513 [Potamilus streckersoni]|uniref:Coiled-coil domain-containing protein 14 n=1 Tax=Potamilus streckersoni TaxID=2493646 RepID=A0AAE0RPK6_9BIVA|nr:hypothetical protein CHS0354_037513 [Potamilus streckersoni]